jgi:hypothetical protein
MEKTQTFLYEISEADVKELGYLMNNLNANPNEDSAKDAANAIYLVLNRIKGMTLD